MRRTLLTIVATCFVLAGCGARDETNLPVVSAASQATLHAAVVEAKISDVPISVEVTGQVATVYQATLSSRIQGTIDRVLVIRELMASGLTVRLIKAVLPHLTDEPEPVCAQFLAEVQDHRDRLAARIAVLTAQQEALDAYLREARRPAP